MKIVVIGSTVNPEHGVRYAWNRESTSNHAQFRSLTVAALGGVELGGLLGLYSIRPKSTERMPEQDEQDGDRHRARSQSPRSAGIKGVRTLGVA